MHKKKKKKEIINFISRETSANYALKIHEGGERNGTETTSRS